MAYKEFYLDPAGSSLNPGGSSDTAADYTTTNGSWNSTTHIYTPTDGSTPATYIAVDDYVSIYTDGASVTAFWARVTAVAGGVNGAITVDATNRCGTAPGTSATARSLKHGGAHKGPSGAQAFPFNGTNLSNLKDAAGNAPCFNCKAGTYSVTSQINMLASTGKCAIDGYTTTIHDNVGYATFDGGTSNIINTAIAAVQDVLFRNLRWQNNGTTGSNDLLQINCSDCTFINCVAGTSRGNSVNLNGANNSFFECEITGANTSNTASKAGLLCTQTGEKFVRCVFHDNTGSNTCGFIAGSGGSSCSLINCIFDSNGSHGFFVTATGQRHDFLNCDFYNNGGAGYSQANQTTIRTRWENCNFVKNTTYGRDFGTQVTCVYSRKCGYGGATGSNQNGTADNNAPVAGSEYTDENPINYTSHPWQDPANGDFRIVSSESAGQGRSAWTQTTSSYDGCASSADIGAVWHLPIIGPPASGGGGGAIVNARVNDMDIPLDEVIYFDAVTHNPVTGAVSDADSTPTFAVYEEATDTDIGVGGNLTKRTSLTGDYRGTFTVSAANGFELGKWYSVIVSATVNAIAGKAQVMHFRIVAAENVAGYPIGDVEKIDGDSAAATALMYGTKTTCFGTCTTGGTTTSVPTSALTPSNSQTGQFVGRTLIFLQDTTTADLRGQATVITAVTGGTFTVSPALTDAPASGDKFAVL